MSNINKFIAVISLWLKEETNKGGLAALRRGDKTADSFLARAGATLPLKNGEAYLEAYSTVGFLLAHGIKNTPHQGGAFLKAFKTPGSQEESPRLIMLTDSKSTLSASQVLKKSVGIFKSRNVGVDMVSVFWALAQWQDRKKRRINMARWFEDYYSTNKEAVNGTN